MLLSDPAYARGGGLLVIIDPASGVVVKVIPQLGHHAGRHAGEPTTTDPLHMHALAADRAAVLIWPLTERRGVGSWVVVWRAGVRDHAGMGEDREIQAALDNVFWTRRTR